MRNLNARMFITLDSVIEAPENWVKADNDMFEAMEADYAQSDALCLVVVPTRRSPLRGRSAAARCRTRTG
jgi:hypothetical protein